MENCIFCKIVKGELPMYKVWEDENYLAFLNITPTHDGHTLLIPKRHEDYFFDLNDTELSELTLKAKPIAKKLKEVFKPRSGKVGMVLAGMGVPHVHVHLIPMDSEQDLNFNNKKTNVSKDYFEAVVAKIRES